MTCLAEYQKIALLMLGREATVDGWRGMPGKMRNHLQAAAVMVRKAGGGLVSRQVIAAIMLGASE